MDVSLVCGIEGDRNKAHLITFVNRRLPIYFLFKFGQRVGETNKEWPSAPQFAVNKVEDLAMKDVSGYEAARHKACGAG